MKWSRLRRAATIAVAAVVVLGVVLLVAKHFLLDRAPVPETSSYRVDMPTVRRLAGSFRGELPVRVNALVVAQSFVPEGAVIAGGGLDEHEMVRTAYQVVYDDGSTMMIDAATNRAIHEEMFAGDPFHPDRYRKLERALDAADLVLITHTHPDHIGAIASSDNLDSLLAKLRFSREQVQNETQLERAHFPKRAIPAIPVLNYDKYTPVAPGVVAIKAPGHTPGSQMVYVRLDNGREYLFVGDIAWHEDNIEELTGRPLAVARWFVGEDRDAVLEQLRTLHDIASQGSVHLVVSHDAEQLERYVENGVLGDGFEL